MKWLGLVIAVIGCYLGVPSAQAAATSIEALTVTINLERNGSVRVTEDIVLDNPSALQWQIFSPFHDLQIQADNKGLPLSQVQRKHKGNGELISTTTSAKLWTVSFVASSALIRQNNRDQLFFKVLEEPAVSVKNIDVRIVLPASAGETQLAGNAYAIGGVSTPQVEKKADSISYGIDFASPKAFVTVNASWPKSVLQLTKSQEFRLWLTNLDIIPWLFLGVSLPLISLVVLLRLLIRQKREEAQTITDQSPRPPTALSPLLAGVLVHKKVNPQQLTALLIDFCQRGYLVIVKKGGDYFIGRRKEPDEHLETWEEEILTEVWPTYATTVSAEEMHMITKSMLFSPKIKDAFSRIYQIITDLHFFAENPHVTRVRYKLVALGFYYLSVFGLVWTALTTNSPYLVIPIFGTMIIAWLIMRLTPKLIHYTTEGRQVRDTWLKFINYLRSTEPLAPEAARNQTFEQYLAYAVALNCTEAWANRFERSNATLIRPDWFITYQDSSAHDFSEELFTFGRKVSSILTNLRGPLVN